MKTKLLLPVLLIVVNFTWLAAQNTKKDLLEQSLTSICHCLDKNGNSEEAFMTCYGEEAEKNKTAIAANYQPGPFSLYTDFMYDVMFGIVDRCQSANKILFGGRSAGYKPVTGNCKGLITGNYFYETQMPGIADPIVAHVTFTDNTYKEMDEKGMVKEAYSLVWNNCNASLVFTGGTVEEIKPGDKVTMAVRRASSDGLIAVVFIQGIETIIEYRREK